MSRHDSFSVSISDFGTRLRRVGLPLVAALPLASCVSLETAVPPVAPLVARGQDPAVLESGRRVYLDACTRCHVAEPVRDYSAVRWPAIISDMAARANLTPAQERAVLAYVLAATQVR